MAAEWIIKGETKYDLFGWDVARCGNWASKKFVKESRDQATVSKFTFQMKKDLLTTPKDKTCIRLSKELGAVFGLNYGWEHPIL